MSTSSIGSKVYGGEMAEPECPPEAEFILMLIDVREPVMGKSFDGKAPQEQLILDFKISAENPGKGSLQEEWNDLDVRSYFTPIIHYGPDLPGYSGQRYTEPSLYKLVKAFNGGTPLAVEIFTSPETGKAFFVPYNAHQARAVVQQFIGRRFRSVVGPGTSGWPRLKGDPMPMLVAAPPRRRSAGAAAEPVPQPQLAGVGAAMDIDDDPFADEGVI